MYSVVLMAALATGGSAPAFHHGGCHGCYGGCYGCYGGCYGCYGGCYGCYGSCYGSYGGCYGCHGCWGSSWAGCYGCYGGCYGGYSCCGCYGGYSWNGGYSFTDSTPTYMAPTGGPEKIAPPEGTDKKGSGTPKKGDSDKKGMEDEAAVDSAKLIVELPEKAKLFVDDRPVKNASTRRTFTTPKLEKGHAYYYILRAELMRDGKTQSESKRVIVRPGEVVRASFTDLTHDATAKVDTKP